MSRKSTGTSLASYMQAVIIRSTGLPLLATHFPPLLVTIYLGLGQFVAVSWDEAANGATMQNTGLSRSPNPGQHNSFTLHLGGHPSISQQSLANTLTSTGQQVGLTLQCTGTSYGQESSIDRQSDSVSHSGVDIAGRVVRLGIQACKSGGCQMGWIASFGPLVAPPGVVSLPSQLQHWVAELMMSCKFGRLFHAYL